MGQVNRQVSRHVGLPPALGLRVECLGVGNWKKISSPMHAYGRTHGLKEYSSGSGPWIGSRTPSSRSVNSISSSTSGWSTSSASGWSALSTTSGMSRSPSVMTQSPDDIPPIDPRAVHDLEIQAIKVAESVEHMMSNLKSSLHKMSSLTSNCQDAYKEGIDRTCDSVDAAIKSMYALMAKCEELTKAIRPVYPLADQIKEIKRLLDLFEGQMLKDEKT